MRPDPIDRPHLRIVHRADRPDNRQAQKASLLARMIAAAEPGDFESLVAGCIVCAVLLAIVAVADNFDIIVAWLRG